MGAFSITKDRLYLFVDNVGDHVYDLEALISAAAKEVLPITIIGAERVNEWNSQGSNLDKYISKEYPIEYLSRREIHELLAKLRRYDCLR